MTIEEARASYLIATQRFLKATLVYGVCYNANEIGEATDQLMAAHKATEEAYGDLDLAYYARLEIACEAAQLNEQRRREIERRIGL